MGGHDSLGDRGQRVEASFQHQLLCIQALAGSSPCGTRLTLITKRMMHNDGMWLPKLGHNTNFCLAPSWVTHPSCSEDMEKRYTADGDTDGVDLHTEHSDTV